MTTVTTVTTGPNYERNALDSLIARLRAQVAALATVPGWGWRANDARRDLAAALERRAKL